MSTKPTNDNKPANLLLQSKPTNIISGNFQQQLFTFIAAAPKDNPNDVFFESWTKQESLSYIQLTLIANALRQTLNHINKQIDLLDNIEQD